jgi:hypothetical protein
MILYFTYKHENRALIKTDSNFSSLMGVWEGAFDSYQCGTDIRTIITIDIKSDSIGTIKYQGYGERINNSFAEVYSWSSLLPFNDKEFYTDEYNISLLDKYFYYNKYEEVLKEKKRYYFLFNISYDSLYFSPIEESKLDSIKYFSVDKDYLSSSQPEIIDLINPIYIFEEYKNLITEFF